MFNPQWSTMFSSEEPVTSNVSDKIKELEKLCGFPIRGEFRPFIEKVNGGKYTFDLTVFNVNDLRQRMHMPEKIDLFFGFYEKDKANDLIENYKMYKDRLCADMLPIGKTKSGNIICIKLDFINPIFLLDLDEHPVYESEDFSEIVSNNTDFELGVSSLGAKSVKLLKQRPLYDSFYYVSPGFSQFLVEVYSPNSLNY